MLVGFSRPTTLCGWRSVEDLSGIVLTVKDACSPGVKQGRLGPPSEQESG
jgi:hypothetical protein